MNFLAETDSSPLAIPTQYRTMVAGNLMPGGPTEALQNGVLNARSEDVIRSLRNYLGGICTFGNMSATLPHNMARYAGWANSRGARLAVHDSIMTLQDPRVHASGKIAEDAPVVLGIATNFVGVVDHYVVAYKHFKNGDSHEFYVNYGWRGVGDDQWISADSITYSAAVVPL